MKGIRRHADITLNKSVKFVGERTTKLESEDIMHHSFKALVRTRDGEEFERHACLYTYGANYPAFIENRILFRDDKPCVKWNEAHIVKDTIAMMLVARDAFVTSVSKQLDSLLSCQLKQEIDEVYINTERVKLVEGLAEDLYNQMVAVAKPDKNGVVSVKNHIRAIAILFGITNADDIIKDIYTLNNQSKKTLYTYETNCFIEQHYSRLHSTQKLKSCMNKGASHSTTHYVECEGDKVRDKRLLKVYGGKNCIFTANVEGYNGSHNVRLLLTSWLPPDELAKSKHYGFIGRAVALKTDTGYSYVKYYGAENTEKYLAHNVERVEHLKKAVVRGYVSTTYTIPTSYGSLPAYVLPYIDGADNVLRIVSGVQHDEIGRAYRLFQVVDGHKYDMDSYTTDDPTDKVVLSQQNWVSTPVKWNGFYCKYTGLPLLYTTGIKFNGELVHFSVASDDADEVRRALYRCYALNK